MTTYTYDVTVSNNDFVLDLQGGSGPETAPTLTGVVGDIFIFNLNDASVFNGGGNSAYTFSLSNHADLNGFGSADGVVYDIDGTTYNTYSAFVTAYEGLGVAPTVVSATLTISSTSPTTMYYWSANQSSLGNSIGLSGFSNRYTYTIPNVRGPQGVQGPAGPQGIQGIQGIQGETGLQGVQGPAGAAGTQGPIGPEGPAGQTGPAGADGSPGLQGPAGPQGPAGAQGEQGIQGDTGSVGPAGPTGVTGPAGETGPAGPTGAQGPAGPQGPQGATGPVGPQGVPGTTAGAFYIAHIYNSIGDLLYDSDPATNVGITTGQFAVIGGDENATDYGKLYLFKGSGQGDAGTVDAWQYVLDMSIQGIQGPQGPAGAQGPAGPAGLQGVAGPAGPAGADGAPGPTGPAGAAGAQGLAGPSGPQGVAGPAGPAGPQGDIGPAGPQGVQGPAGPGGATGATGAQGPAGTQGPQGSAGPTGPQGASISDVEVNPVDPTEIRFSLDTNPVIYTNYVTLPAGAQGPAATIDAGTFTPVAASASGSVTNSGSASAAVFNFQVPRGYPGGVAGITTPEIVNSTYATAENREIRAIVNASDSPDGYLKIFDEANSQWVNVNVRAVDDLNDVTITSVSDGELLVYDNATTAWINQTKTEAGFGTLSGLNSLALDDLTDVDLTSNAPTSGQTLTYDGTNFVPTTPLNPLIYAIALG